MVFPVPSYSHSQRFMSVNPWALSRITLHVVICSSYILKERQCEFHFLSWILHVCWEVNESITNSACISASDLREHLQDLFWSSNYFKPPITVLGLIGTTYPFIHIRMTNSHKRVFWILQQWLPLCWRACESGSCFVCETRSLRRFSLVLIALRIPGETLCFSLRGQYHETEVLSHVIEE